MTSQIELLSLTIVEPMTTLTDYMITVAACYFGLQLAFSRRDEQRCRYFWAVGFMFIGLGALLGGTSHGFVNYLSDAALNAVWKGTLATVGLSMAFAVAGTVISNVSLTAWRKLLHGLNVIGLLFYTAWVSRHGGYLAVIVITVASLGLIAMLQMKVLVRNNSSAARWIVAGVLVSFLSAAIQRSGIALHQHFNHNDLYHVVQLLGLYLLYRGVAQLRDQDVLAP